MITLRQMRYLVALAEQQYFGRAAEACDRTVPRAVEYGIKTVSRHGSLPKFVKEVLQGITFERTTLQI
jgi:DNA-binding transcriptional LysR family regulator